ncbi:MAG: MFS transporter, partial [Lysobacterales bacterium]
MPLPVWRLMLAYALMMAGSSLMVLIAGIIGVRFAPSPGLATLPIALAVVGLASSTLPTGRLLDRFGRRRVFVAYGLLAVSAALLASFSLVRASFGGFCLAASMMGWATAAGHQYRFAALELVPAEQAPKATSILLLGGILAAFVGPEIAVRGRALLATEYAGSFLLLAVSYGAGIVLVSLYRDPGLQDGGKLRGGRSLAVIVRSPLVILAIAASALGYGVMSLVMTAGPVSMHEYSHHSLEATKVVLQSHIAGMYLPALVYPWLFSKLHFRGMLWGGWAAFAVCLSIASIDTTVLHYWLTMVLL